MAVFLEWHLWAWSWLLSGHFTLSGLCSNEPLCYQPLPSSLLSGCCKLTADTDPAWPALGTRWGRDTATKDLSTQQNITTWGSKHLFLLDKNYTCLREVSYDVLYILRFCSWTLWWSLSSDSCHGRDITVDCWTGTRHREEETSSRADERMTQQTSGCGIVTISWRPARVILSLGHRVHGARLSRVSRDMHWGNIVCQELWDTTGFQSRTHWRHCLNNTEREPRARLEQCASVPSLCLSVTPDTLMTCHQAVYCQYWITNVRPLKHA